MKKKIAFFLMLMVILAAMVWGSGNTLKKERGQIMDEYRDQYAASVGANVAGSIEKTEHLIKLARQYTDQNSALEPLCMGLEETMSEISDRDQAPPLTLQQLYAQADALAAELQRTGLQAEDEAYPKSLMTDLLSMRDQIRHAAYNDRAQAWNAKLGEFPALLLQPVFSFVPLEVYSGT